MGTLRIENLTKAFPATDGSGTIVAVDGVTLTAEDGEFLVMLGPSGCGKSTTLRCIAGLESPTSGTVQLNGNDITAENTQKRDMAMVFQDFALYPHMTAEGNMGFGLKMTTDLSKDEIREQVEEAAEIMSIGELLDKKPSQLSGGQKQRVALGRAIVRDPEVFLMDEPLSNLDAKLRTQMRTEIQRLHRKLEVTTIYVTHDQTEAMTMGDRIAILNDGELQQIGTPDDVYHHPVNQFVAGFIGSPSMNFLQVRVTEQNEMYRLIADGESSFDYSLHDETVERTRISEGDSLTIGVRPEAIQLPTESPTIEQDSDRVQEAFLDVVEPMGSDNYLYLQVGDNSWTARVDSSVKPVEGEAIQYAFDRAALHLFDSNGNTLKSAGTDESAFSTADERRTSTPASATDGGGSSDTVADGGTRDA